LEKKSQLVLNPSSLKNIYGSVFLPLFSHLFSVLQLMLMK